MTCVRTEFTHRLRSVQYHDDDAGWRYDQSCAGISWNYAVLTVYCCPTCTLSLQLLTLPYSPNHSPHSPISMLFLPVRSSPPHSRCVLRLTSLALSSSSLSLFSCLFVSFSSSPIPLDNFPHAGCARGRLASLPIGFVASSSLLPLSVSTCVLPYAPLKAHRQHEHAHCSFLFSSPAFFMHAIHDLLKNLYVVCVTQGH